MHSSDVREFVQATRDNCPDIVGVVSFTRLCERHASTVSSYGHRAVRTYATAGSAVVDHAVSAHRFRLGICRFRSARSRFDCGRNGFGERSKCPSTITTRRDNPVRRDDPRKRIARNRVRPSSCAGFEPSDQRSSENRPTPGRPSPFVLNTTCNERFESSQNFYESHAARTSSRARFYFNRYAKQRDLRTG